MRNVFKRRELLICLAIFAFFLFTRFYQLEQRSEFRWDQVDNAWAVKNILVDGKLPLVGMVAKQNTGFYIGPLYYYFITPFYWLFNLDPIASAVISRVTSVFTFFVLYFVAKKIFSKGTALVAIFLYTLSFNIINADSYQWPINFVPAVSLLIFYFLYRILSGSEKSIIPLAILTGISFHLNFTAVFFPIIILLTIPFFPRTKETVKYLLMGLSIFFVFFIPNILYELQYRATSTSHMFSYIGDNYHGFHVRRFFQLMPLAFIEYKSFFSIFSFDWIGFLILPVFITLLKFSKIAKKNLLILLSLLWLVVPWAIFSVYTGEITDYYFSLSILMVLMTTSFIVVTLFKNNNLLSQGVAIVFILLFSLISFNKFLTFNIQGIDYQKSQAKKAISEGKIINFTQGDPQSYLYYIYKERKEK